MTTDARAAVAANPLWYHTLDVAPGVTTPGWFDLRPILDDLPWPDVHGKRCLDVGTYDGHLAFELERRGASEVVATDISHHAQWDWPSRIRARGVAALPVIAGEKGAGFRTAAQLLGSQATREEISVYDLTPERVGTFDVVVCGSLTLHLRDPLRALEAIRSVCTGRFLAAETLRPQLEAGPLRRRPVAELDGVSDLCQWWTPNRAGHRRMVEAAGFDVVEAPRPFCIPLGPAHPAPPRTLPVLARAARTYVAGRGVGVLTGAVLARPAA